MEAVKVFVALIKRPLSPSRVSQKSIYIYRHPRMFLSGISWCSDRHPRQQHSGMTVSYLILLLQHPLADGGG